MLGDWRELGGGQRGDARLPRHERGVRKATCAGVCPGAEGAGTCEKSARTRVVGWVSGARERARALRRRALVDICSRQQHVWAQRRRERGLLEQRHAVVVARSFAALAKGVARSQCVSVASIARVRSFWSPPAGANSTPRSHAASTRGGWKASTLPSAPAARRSSGKTAATTARRSRARPSSRPRGHGSAWPAPSRGGARAGPAGGDRGGLADPLAHADEPTRRCGPTRSFAANPRTRAAGRRARSSSRCARRRPVGLLLRDVPADDAALSASRRPATGTRSTSVPSTVLSARESARLRDVIVA